MTVILAVVDSRIAQFHQQLRSHLVQFAIFSLKLRPLGEEKTGELPFFRENSAKIFRIA